MIQHQFNLTFVEKLFKICVLSTNSFISEEVKKIYHSTNSSSEMIEMFYYKHITLIALSGRFYLSSTLKLFKI